MARNLLQTKIIWFGPRLAIEERWAVDGPQMRRTPNSRLWRWMGAMFLAARLVAPARAQDPDDSKRGVARLSLADGEVSVERGDSGDWVAASVNAPVVTNDRISTGPNSRTEVQFDASNVLRIGSDAEVSLTQLDYSRYQMALARGTATFRVLRSSNLDIEVDTPNISVRPSKQGAYRIAVTDAGSTEVTVRSGEVEVFTPRGSEWVRSGQTLVARGSASDPEYQIVSASRQDEWDRWNDSRDQAMRRSASYPYVGPGVYGVEDLDPYGTWVDVPGYGYVWRPLVVAGWAPYRQGRWVWEDWYGWTWVSYEPWGWAPYHYGRWFYEPAFGWCWYPGLVGVRHYWSPALVAFFGFGGGVGVSFGVGNVGWVPLAPYEVLHPWWGRGFYGGRDSLRSINITNVNITNVYRNARVTNGVTAVSGGDFRGGRFTNFVHASPDQLQQAGVVRGAMPIAPDRSNLRFTDRQNAFVPRPSGNNRFFTRQQPNPAPRVSFAEQQRALEGTNRGRFGDPAAAGAWQRSEGGRGNQPTGQPAPATPSNNRGWNRFGEPRNTPRPQQPESIQGRAETPRAETPRFAGPRSEAGTWRSEGGRGNQPAGQPSPAAPSNNRGWNRFGEPRNTLRPQQPETIQGRAGTPRAETPRFAPPRSESGAWQRSGDGPGYQPAVRPSPAAPSKGPGWNRFGEPWNAGRPQRPETVQRRAEAPRFAAPRSEAPPSRSEFGNPMVLFNGRNAPPRASEAGRQESLRISPPVVRERPSGSDGGYNGPPSGPRGGGGSRGSGGDGGNNHRGGRDR